MDVTVSGEICNGKKWASVDAGDRRRGDEGKNNYSGRGWMGAMEKGWKRKGWMEKKEDGVATWLTAQSFETNDRVVTADGGGSQAHGPCAGRELTA